MSPRAAFNGCGLPGVNALNKDEMAANDLNLFAKVFLPIKLMVT
jgi:hypothetical protein